MAIFELFDNDDLLSGADTLETECPICGKEISFSLDDIGLKITCPHCNAEIELSSG